MKIFFVDYKKTLPYSAEDLEASPLNGTAGSVIRIAEKLGEQFDVFVLHKMQNKVVKGKSNTLYAPLSMVKLLPKPDIVITVRLHPEAVNSFTLFPRANHLFWVHDLPSPHQLQLIKKISSREASIVTVSETHRKMFSSLLLKQPPSLQNVSLYTIYNPVDDELKKEATLVDPYKLHFCSNPMKGLKNALAAFSLIKEADERFHLSIANPSRHIKADILKRDKSIKYLGHLSHSENISHIRSALSLFYPNNSYPETFGLVFAEALAVGTPVLTHNLGAAKELINNGDMLVDCNRHECIVEKVLLWSRGERPVVELDEKFRLSTVYKKWVTLLQL